MPKLKLDAEIAPEVTSAPLWRRTVPRKTPVLVKTTSRVVVVCPGWNEPTKSGERWPVSGWKAKTVKSSTGMTTELPKSP